MLRTQIKESIHLKFDKRINLEMVDFLEQYNLKNKTKISKTKLIEVAVQEFLDKYKDDVKNIRIQ